MLQLLKNIGLFCRDYFIQLLALTSFIIVVLYPYIGFPLISLLVYIIFAQFKPLWFYRPLRWLGYYSYYLQYSNEVIMNTESGRILLRDKEIYHYDYIMMGYNEFDLYIEEMVALERMHSHLTADEMLMACFD